MSLAPVRKIPSETWCSTATSAQVLQAVESPDPSIGLSHDQCSLRIARFGYNDCQVVKPTPTQHVFLLVLRKAHAMAVDNPLILLLLASAGISLLLGQIQDAISITLAIVIVLSVSHFQEQQSEKSLEALKQLMPHFCNVLRGGVLTRTNALNLVPGDIVHLSVGDRIPADLRFIRIANEGITSGPSNVMHGSASHDALSASQGGGYGGKLYVDESTLTGESRPVQKQTDPVPWPSNQVNELGFHRPNVPLTSSPLSVHSGTMSNTGGSDVTTSMPLNERKNIGFMGTLVVSGSGTGVIIATGPQTELGRIFHMLSSIAPSETPLQHKMKRLGEQLALLSIAVIISIGCIGVLLQGRGIFAMFTIGVSLAVAAIPEGLPIVVTVTLALGVIRMARQNVIIKKLSAVEGLGSVTVLALDKTGTITINQMTVQQMWTFGSSWKRPDSTTVGQLHPRSGNPATLSPAMRTLISIGNLCNASARNEKGRFMGQPTERSIMDLVDYFGLTDERPLASWDPESVSDSTSNGSPWIKCSEIPFDSETQWMAVEYAPVNGDKGLSGTTSTTFFVKGSSEALIEKCTSYIDAQGSIRPLDVQVRAIILDQAAQLSRDSGLRVLAASSGPSLNALIFAGLFGLQDPIRPGISAMFQNLVGVHVVIITGDSKEMAYAIAKETGILSSGQERFCMSGQELDSLIHASSSNLTTKIPAPTLARIKGCRVFYRTSPKHKMTVIQALQQCGEIVAMSGDGVNDAPALRLADIGIALGSGTDVSKEAADVVLVRDDIPILLAAIEEGKSLYANIQSFLSFQLSTSVSALVLIALCILLGLPNPMNAMQILWINILCDGPVAQSLGVEAVSADVRRAGPIRKEDPILTPALLKKIAQSSCIIIVGTLFVLLRNLPDDPSHMSKREMTMVFTTFVFFDLWNSLSCRSRTQSIFSIGFFTNIAYNYAFLFCLCGQLFVIYIPWFQSIFQTQSLSLMDLLILVALSSSVFWFDEAMKRQRWWSRSYDYIPKADENV